MSISIRPQFQPVRWKTDPGAEDAERSLAVLHAAPLPACRITIIDFLPEKVRSGMMQKLPQAYLSAVDTLPFLPAPAAGSKNFC